tara:strand:- start:726 stop:1142 length:417 start_codon:yes stop_codon:yes gene_type:complete
MQDKDENIIHEFIATIKAENQRVIDTCRNMAKFDTLPRAIWDFSENFIYVNELFASKLGYSQEEMNGKPFVDFIYEDDINKSLEAYTTHLDTVTVIEGFTNRYKHKDGRIMFVKWLKFFNDFDNKIGSGQVEISDLAL